MTGGRGDGGFSLIELLLVIVILGMVATIVAFSVGGLTADAQGVGCEADQRALVQASEAYFAQRAAASIPPADATAQSSEMTLVAEGFLHSPSEWHDLGASGRLVGTTDSPCGP